MVIGEAAWLELNRLGALGVGRAVLQNIMRETKIQKFLGVLRT
jgi:hypothetical protein